MKNVHNRRGKQGFASMTKELRSHIAGLGGKAAQASGRAHRWNRKEAIIAGRMPKKPYAKRKNKD